MTKSSVESVLPNGRRHRTLFGPFRTGRAYVTGLAYSPHGHKLALSFGPYHRRSSLYVVRANGRGRLRRLTRSLAVDFGPAWAPDGRRLAFIRSSGRSFGIRVYRAGRSREIIGQPADNLAWSARGQIAFAYDAGGSAASQPEIYVTRPNGSHTRRIVDGGGDPDFSPNGRWIVYTQWGWLGGLGPAPPDPRLYKTSIALIRRDGSDQRVLTDHDGAGDPAFSPDGKYIVFVRDDESHRSTLVLMRLRDRSTRTIATTPPSGPVPGSPDRYEQHLLYSPTWQPLPRRRHR